LIRHPVWVLPCALALFIYFLSLVSDRFQRHWLPTGVFRPKATTRKINQTIDSLFHSLSLSRLSTRGRRKQEKFVIFPENF
jgi:hypothetical protein